MYIVHQKCSLLKIKNFKDISFYLRWMKFNNSAHAAPSPVSIDTTISLKDEDKCYRSGSVLEPYRQVPTKTFKKVKTTYVHT